MNAFDFVDKIDDRIANYVSHMREVLPEDMDIDSRSAYRLYVDQGYTCIVCNKQDDSTLRYYSGFEYVQKDCRREMGNWVFYFDDDERVREHLDHLRIGEIEEGIIFDSEA